MDRDPRPQSPDCSKQEPRGRAEVPPRLDARGGVLHADPYLLHLEWLCPRVLQMGGHISSGSEELVTAPRC